MKAKVTVTELTHDELVDILSTALYDCDYLTADYDTKAWKEIPQDKKHGNCFEDHLADVLLNDGIIFITDNEANGELYKTPGVPCHLEKPAWWEQGQDDDSCVVGVYEVNLKAILKACSTPRGYKLLTETLNGEGDYFTANNLLQIAMFGEEIYG